MPACLCPSFRVEQLGSHWISMKFDIWAFLEKFVDKTQVPLKSDKNNGHFILRPIYI
jgi:hypothetical protein